MAPDLNALYNNKKARLYIEMADKYLEIIGYPEHGLRHTDIVSKEAYNSRMTACRKAAKVLNCEFQLYINSIRLA